MRFVRCNVDFGHKSLAFMIVSRIRLDFKRLGNGALQFVRIIMFVPK